jgi:hypothetical protein
VRPELRTPSVPSTHNHLEEEHAMTGTLTSTAEPYLDRSWTTGGGGTLTTTNPATGNPLAEVAAADAADVGRRSPSSSDVRGAP